MTCWWRLLCVNNAVNCEKILLASSIRYRGLGPQPIGFGSVSLDVRELFHTGFRYKGPKILIKIRCSGWPSLQVSIRCRVFVRDIFDRIALYYQKYVCVTNVFISTSTKSKAHKLS